MTEEQSSLSSFGTGLRVAVVGASGGIGRALVHRLSADPAVAEVYRLSRRDEDPGKTPWLPLDLMDEGSIASSAAQVGVGDRPLHLVFVATGVLHADERLQPEKSWRDLEPESLEQSFRINAIGPALVAKHFLPLLPRDRKTCFAALSARVGSIADNRLGGWYGYRASKAALNMLIRTLAIELGRRWPQAVCVGLHPGTVDTPLSAPFQRNVPDDRLFAPERAARELLAVVDGLEPADSGMCFAWDGAPVPY